MINGEEYLRQKYPDLDENQYQPSGIDLKLGELKEFNNTQNYYGIYDGIKDLPEQKNCETVKIENVNTDGEVTGYFLEPNIPYIAVTEEKINISLTSGQLYLPRSSLLRAGVDVRTAYGDNGFNGHLSFLIINHNDTPFFLEKGERFAQLIDIQITDTKKGYNGDYQEK